MSNWYKMPPSFRITEGEYKANVDGINIVFGAVLGFVLVGGEGLPVRDFVALLFLSAAVVVMILYLGQSEYKLFYVVLTAVTIAAFPFIAEDFFQLARVPKLQPTLAVWAIMVLLVELIPREKPEAGGS
uniref:hypothetical protein n=1 Tax=uncultured Erythrobacter sp. TaxID=263913 RepID=UPI0026388BAD|nr:hypothetical protein [uncultured Erythrobacter sp.]